MTTYPCIMSYVLFSIMLMLQFYCCSFEFTTMPTYDVSEVSVWPIFLNCLTPNLRLRTDGCSEYQVWVSLSILMLDLVLGKLPGSLAASSLCEISTAQQFTVP